MGQSSRMTETAERRQSAPVVGERAGPAARLKRLAGARSGLLLAFAAGAVAAFALPPFHLLPLLLLSVPLLVWLVGAASGPARAGWIGFLFGLGHHMVGLYWISHSLLIDPWRHGWLIPIFVGGLAALLAVFAGLAAAGARAFAGRRSLALLLAFSGLWILGEWLRSWVFTGFSWNLLGSVWLVSDPMAQLAALTGTWGLSVLALLAAGSIAVAADAGAGRAARLAAVPAAALLLGGAFLYGSERLSGPGPGSVEGVRLRLVQPNIPQTLKWDARLAEAHLLKQMRMSVAGDTGASVTHVIWPETAVPFALERNPGLAESLARIVPPRGLLITGIPRVTQSSAGEAWHNGMVALDSAGAVRGTFDKFHLVPFGEYVPIRFLPGVNRIAPGESDFVPGPGPRTVVLPGLPPVSPLICYEVIFPGAVTDPDARPAVMVNVTNDGWFGTSTGPSQHFAIARFRTVEEGIPMLRAANTGISGVIDAYGRVETRSNLMVEAVIDATIPPALPPTPFARFGLLAVLPLIVLALIPILFRVRRSSIS
jgi:apolipoprotein N-acyltransferase